MRASSSVILSILRKDQPISSIWKIEGICSQWPQSSCETVSRIIKRGWHSKIAKGMEVESETKVLKNTENGQDPAETIQSKSMAIRYTIVFCIMLYTGTQL